MKKFRKFFNDYKELLEYIVGFATAPMILKFLAIAPPWPDTSAVALFTSVVAIVVLMVTFANSDYLKHVQLRSYINWSAPVLLTCVVGYIILTSFFVYRGPRGQVPRGFILKPDIVKALNSNPDDTPDTLLEGMKYDPTRIWEANGVYWNQSLLLLSWLAFFIALSFLLSLFVLQQQSKKPPGNKAPKRK